jgi:hypothetical protein
MTGSQVIDEIKRLPRDERRKVIDFARTEVDAEQLSPAELGELARQMVETPDASEAERLKREIIRGFYGAEPHA